MSDMVTKAYAGLDDGHRQLMMNVLADVENEGGEKRSTDLRGLIAELNEKIETVRSQKSKWQRLVDDAEMLLAKLPQSGSGDKVYTNLRMILATRISEYKGLLQKVGANLDNAVAKKRRIENRLATVSDRREFATRVLRDLTKIDGRRVTEVTAAEAEAEAEEVADAHKR